MSDSQSQILQVALRELENLFATTPVNEVEENKLSKACVEVIAKKDNKPHASVLHFYAGVRFFTRANLFHALFHMLECLQSDAIGELRQLCRPYVDYIEKQNIDHNGMDYNLGFLYRVPYFRQKNYIYARSLQLPYFREGCAGALTAFGSDFFYGHEIRQNDHIAYGLFRAGAEGATDGLPGLLLTKALGIAPVGQDGLLPDYERLARVNRSLVSPFIIRACVGFCGEQNLSAASVLASERAQDGDLSDQLLYNALADPDFQNFLSKDPTAASMINDYGWNLRPTVHLEKPRSSNHARNLSVLASVVAQLATTESHSYEFQWAKIAARLGCHYWNLRYQDVLRNSLAIGRRLQSTTRFGIPIAKWPPTKTLIKLRPPQRDGFVLYVREKEIKCVSGRFAEHRRLYHPRLFDRGDLLVAMALAFAGDQAEHPAFSIESLGDGFVEQRLIPIKNRVYGPPWLAGTSIGHSLYLADQMMPTFGLGCQFSWRDFFHNARFEPKLHRSQFGQEIEDAGGINPYPVGRNSIDSKSVHPNFKIRRPWWYSWGEVETYELTRMEMRFDASYIYYNAVGIEKRNGFPNDPKTQLGHRAAIGTRRYEELARAFPVLARIRLFLMVAATLAKLSEGEGGHKASLGLRRKLQRLRGFYETRSPERFPIFRSYSNLPRLERDGA